MANWKKIITSGSNAALLNITSSGGVQIGTVEQGTTGTDNVLVRNATSGKIHFVTQGNIGNQGSSVLTFATMSVSGQEALTASSATDTLNFVEGDNVDITGVNSTNTLTFSAVTKSAAEITSILSQSLTSGTHQNITINEPTSGVFSLTGSSAVIGGTTPGQTGITIVVDSNQGLTASLSGLRTIDSPRFADITATGNISASGFISASALAVDGDVGINGNLALDGNFLFDGYNFETSDILNHSGSNIFGAGGADPATLFQDFTGSLSITGSGITLVGGTFTGDGSGLTNLSATSLPEGLLSSSFQIASDISGAYTADNITIKKEGGEFSAKLAAVATNETALADGSQIATYINTESGSLKDFVASNYITEVKTSDLNSGLTGGATSGVVDLQLDINSLGTVAITAAQQFAFNDDTDNVTKKATLGALAAFVTGSTAGTVTNIVTGLGLTGGDITTAGTINVGPGTNIAVSSDGVSLTDNVTLAGTITAVTGSFTHLRVTGETTIIESENLFISDNFMTLNSNIGDGVTPSEDSGITINRGAETNANLYWEENGSNTANGNERWAVSLSDGVTTTATPNAYITTVSSSVSSPSDSTPPSYGGSSHGYGNMHVDTNTGEIWMYV